MAANNDLQTASTIRTFVAIELSDEIKGVLSELMDTLRSEDIRGLRLVRPEGVHLTLKFLGDIPIGKADAVADALSCVKAHSPFELEIDGTGVFPNQRRPRVLWVGVKGDMAPLNALQEDVEDALESIGFRRESRGFSPHLTIGRIRDSASTRDRLRAAEALTSYHIQAGHSIVANTVSLMRTTLLPEGSVHECLVSTPLKGGYRNKVK